MRKTNTRFLLAATALLVGCGPSDAGEDAPSYEADEAGVAVETSAELGEESAQQLAKDQTYDQERAGSRLVLAYDEQTNSFTGTVENVGEEPLSRVRVEVHLSNGVELGPTTPGDLAPGESRPVSLEASEEPFETWSAHAEVGGAQGENEHEAEGGEHEGEGGEHGGSHEGRESGERRGEHRTTEK